MDGTAGETCPFYNQVEELSVLWFLSNRTDNNVRHKGKTY